MRPVKVVNILFVLVLLPILLIPYWKIFSKAAFHCLLALLMIVPVINLPVFYYVAFSKWRTQQDYN